MPQVSCSIVQADKGGNMIRTIALVGHSRSGKTTLGEALLVQTGARERPGRVEEGSTASDYTPEERAHGFSVRTAVLPLHYREHQIFLLDAPGYADFVGEIRGALEAADAAVVTVSAEAGVQVGTERAWTVAQRLGVARMVVVTQLDRGGDFQTLLTDLQSTLGNLVPVHLPIHEGDRLVGIIDVLHHRAYRYDQGKAHSIAIPTDQSEAVTRFQQMAREAIIETDEGLLASYLEGGEVAEGAFPEPFTRLCAAAWSFQLLWPRPPWVWAPTCCWSCSSRHYPLPRNGLARVVRWPRSSRCRWIPLWVMWPT
jgi:elongation factor G